MSAGDILPESTNACPTSPTTDIQPEQSDIDAATRWKGIWGSFADRLPVEDLAYALARHRLTSTTPTFGQEANFRTYADDADEAMGAICEAATLGDAQAIAAAFLEGSHD
jgi:hypothetical protein